MPIYSINVATVSWIDRDRMGPFAGIPLNIFAADAWLKQVTYGMAHTANPDPGQTFDGRGYSPGVTLQRQFRSLTTFTLGLQTDAAGNFTALRSEQTGVVDPGYTPPFDNRRQMWLGSVLQELITIEPGISAKIITEASQFNPGEASSLSAIVQPDAAWTTQGVKVLPYSAIQVWPGEVVLGQSLIKFRAGANGDYIGIVAFGVPNHVPWVWCELVITFAAPNLILYGAASAFPSHAWFVGGQRRAAQPLDNDTAMLKRVFTSGMPAQIQTMQVTDPRGMPARIILTSVNQQSPKVETTSNDPVFKHPYTAPMGGPQQRIVIPLAGLPASSGLGM
jgi:hypothetical protein